MDNTLVDSAAGETRQKHQTKTNSEYRRSRQTRQTIDRSDRRTKQTDKSNQINIRLIGKIPQLTQTD